jgi:hypothetical protein
VRVSAAKKSASIAEEEYSSQIASGNSRGSAAPGNEIRTYMGLIA